MASNKRPPHASCASCTYEMLDRACIGAKKGAKGCPTLTAAEALAEANQEYEKDDVRSFARTASIQEAECYANRHQQPYVMQPEKTRIAEICEFANRMGYKRLGLAFCGGLVKEAAIVADIFETHGFDVVSVMCKAGGTPKSQIDLTAEQTIYHNINEPICNPIFQAQLMNRENTELNVLLGLCVGHDALFFKYAHGPTTVLAVKDRVTGHNPLAPIYLAESYYQKVRGVSDE